MSSPSFKNHLLYWIVPAAFTLACILFYYLNPWGLSQIIAPPVNREFGLIENLQLALLILIFALAIKGIKRGKTRLEKYGFLMVAAVTAFIFLEEIDYGLHYYEYLTGYNNSKTVKVNVFGSEIRNIHNKGKSTLTLMKLASYAVIALFFAVLPLVPAKKKEKVPLLYYLSPSRYIIGTAISLLVLNQIALYFYQNYNYTNRSLDSNVSEFEEMMTYYIAFLYIREMVRKPKQVSTPKTSMAQSSETVAP